MTDYEIEYQNNPAACGEPLFETADVPPQIGAFGVGLFQYSSEELTELRFSQIRFESDKEAPEY